MQPLTIPDLLKRNNVTSAPRKIPTRAEFWRYIRIYWHYPHLDRHDLRLDLLRGFAVFVMVVDHFGGPSWLYLISGNNSFFTSGAEAFVVISGLVVGMRYGDILRREGFKSAALTAFKRAFLLYRLTIIMTLSFAAVSVLFNLPWGRGVDLGDPLTFVFNVLLLHETYYLVDIPMMYTIFMAVVPVGLWLLYKNHTGILLAMSFAVWVAHQSLNSAQIVIFPIIGNTTFHLAAWQLFFAYAIAIGYHRKAIEARIPRASKWIYFMVAAILFFVLLDFYLIDINVLQMVFPGFHEAVLAAQLFNKSTVAPGRILGTIFLFQFLYLLLTLFRVPIQKALAWFLLPLGQSSLYCYTMHVPLIALFYITMAFVPAAISQDGVINTGFQLAALALIWVMTRKRFLFSIVPR